MAYKKQKPESVLNDFSKFAEENLQWSALIVKLQGATLL